MFYLICLVKHVYRLFVSFFLASPEVNAAQLWSHPAATEEAPPQTYDGEQRVSVLPSPNCPRKEKPQNFEKTKNTINWYNLNNFIT